MSLWVAVHGLRDGVDVSADTFNTPIFELAERTNYLYNRLQDLAGLSTFESVRLYNVPLTTTGALAPEIKDVVCLDNETGLYVKAQASMSLLDEFVAADSAFAIGILISKTGTTGTVLIQGRLPLTTSGVAWTLTDLLETDEVFRNGQYYLSSIEPGKLTSTPSGPLIYLGSFMRSATDATKGDYAVLNPQHRDTGESHVHRSFKLYSQPAGRQYVTGTTPEDKHYVIGFRTAAVEAGAVDPEDRIPRLVCGGRWTGTAPVNYTFWLSNDGLLSTPSELSTAPTGFNDAYLHWQSSDLTEGTGGRGATRIWSFESPVSIGSYGTTVSLENPTGVVPLEGDQWDILYAVVTDTPDKRTWTVEVPTETVGWRPRLWRQYFADHPAVDGKFSMILMGGPHVQADKRLADTITVVCAEIHAFDMLYPAVWDTTVIGAYTFEYVDAGDTVTDGNIAVLRAGDIYDPTGTYDNLLTAIRALDDSTITPVIDVTEATFLVGTPTSTTVTHRGVVASALTAGEGTVTVGAGDAAFLVYDQYNHNLVANYGTLYWNNAELWQFAALTNGLQILLVPYDSDGTASTSATVEVGDYWACDLADTAPGANFVYTVEMHQSLVAYYPPIPAKVAALVLNGVELDSAEFFGDAAVYNLAPDSIHWYSDAYNTVPWATDWTSISEPGSEQLQPRMLLHFVRGTIGNSGYVTSLRAAPDAPIRVLQCGTNEPGTVGDLMLDLDLELSTQDANVVGYQVVKATDGSKLRRGPVVERIRVGAGLTMTQSGNAPAGQGIVTLGLSADGSGFAGDFEEVALENAKQELIGMFPYIRLLGWETGGNNTPTGFTAKFRVPHTLDETATYRVIIFATMFGEEDVTLVADMQLPRAGLQFTYSVLPDVFALAGSDVSDPRGTAYGNLQENLIEPDNPRMAAVAMGDLTMDPVYKSYDPMLLHNNPLLASVPRRMLNVFGNPFPSPDDLELDPVTTSMLGVRAGSLVAIRISRADLLDPTDEYTGALGFISLRWSLIRVEE
jgi:hypothetical protein